MKVLLKKYRIFTFIFALTFLALMYVNQQVLIYQMGLKVKENYSIYSKLVDQNRISVYNILDLKSPVSLEKKLLARKIELDIPCKWQVVKIEKSPERSTHNEIARKGLFANLFSLGREAEASPNVNTFVSKN